MRARDIRRSGLLPWALTGTLCLSSSGGMTGCTAPPVSVPDDDPDDPAMLEPDPEAEGLVAVFDLDRQNLPLPTDLWRAGGVITVPPVDTWSPAEAALLQTINGRDGWPRQSAVFIPTSGTLDASTDDRDARLFDLDRQQAIDLVVEIEPGGVRLVPDEPLSPGSTYVYALLTSAQSTDGEALKPTEAFSRLLADEALDDRNEEALRQLVSPWVAALVLRGVARSELAIAGAFTTSALPAPVFAPRFGEHAIPSAFLRDDDGRLALPAGSVDALLASRLHEYDGFSTTAPVRFSAEAPLDPEGPLGEGGLQLFELTASGAALPADEVDAIYLDAETYALSPRVALPAATNLALVVRGPMTSDGQAVQAELADLVLALEHPVIDEGRSTVRMLATADAAALEPQRVGLAAVRDTLRAEPDGLEGVLHLRPFRTLDARRAAFERRQRLYDDAIPTAPSDVVEATPNERGLWLLLPNIDTILSGTVPTLDWLDPTTRADSDEGPTVRDIDFVLTLPDDVPAGEAVPVVLFGHGLKTTRELVYILADLFASQGFASLAIDLPYHGERSVCLSDTNCPGDSRCSIYGQCLNEAGDVVDIGVIESPFWDNGLRIPPTTGAAYIDFYDLIASRDHVMQSLVDLSQAVRVIQGVDWNQHGPRPLDGDDIVYMGISLGGILGAALAGMEDNITTYALNVPGAGFVELMQDSVVLGPQLDDYLEDIAVLPGTPAFNRFEADAKWAFDIVDPVNLAPRPSDSSKRLLIQMAQGDAVVPNSATRLLGAATGREVSEYDPGVLGHGFIGDPTQIASGDARDEILEFFAGR
jgi:hypothetical protein